MSVIGCSDGGPERDDAGTVVSEGEIHSFDLRVGDCFEDPGDGEVGSVYVVPCDQPHGFEVYYSFDLPDGAMPQGQDMEDAWVSGCLSQFEPFVGSPFDSSTLDISAIYPTDDTWDGGDREVLCSVTPYSGGQTVGSAGGTGI
ncbi:MAG: septum formation family protein [Acidimicrobiales bacterium]